MNQTPKIPDRIEDMSPLPSPHKKGYFDVNETKKGKNLSVSPDFHA